MLSISVQVTLSVGRNPLEKPAVEQARQGIGVIRRFFGWSKKDAASEAQDPAGRADARRLRDSVEYPEGMVGGGGAEEAGWRQANQEAETIG